MTDMDMKHENYKHIFSYMKIASFHTIILTRNTYLNNKNLDIHNFALYLEL